MSTTAKDKRNARLRRHARVRKHVAPRDKDAGDTKVVYDRGDNHYHGRVAALADAAREAGLEL